MQEETKILYNADCPVCRFEIDTTPPIALIAGWRCALMISTAAI